MSSELPSLTAEGRHSEAVPKACESQQGRGGGNGRRKGEEGRGGGRGGGKGRREGGVGSSVELIGRRLPST